MRQLRQNSILKRILVPLLLLVILQVAVLAGLLFGGGVMNRLNQNSVDIINERVINRKNYLEDEMVKRWSNLDSALNGINQSAEKLKTDDSKKFSRIDSDSSVYTGLLDESMEELISLIRQNMVTGAFVVLNTKDLSKEEESRGYQNKPGIYIRDYDPVAAPSENNTDLLAERMPSALVKKWKIGMDTGWNSGFDFKDSSVDYYSFLYEPYMAAEKYPELKTADLAYWSKTYTLANNPKEVISYSVPLGLSDGTVYGVLGIELSTDYLKKLISFNELSENKNSAYILGVQDGGKGNQLQNVMVSGPAYNMYMKQSKSINLVASKDYDNAFTIGGSDADLLCSNVHYINLYNTNTPFADQKWALIGVVPTEQLFSFSNKFNKTLVIVVTALFIASIIGVLVISILITRPVISLASDVKNSNPSEPIALRRTGVKELDELGGSFEKLSADVFQASRKFAQILRMASIKIGGFEIDWNENQIFMTEDFFRVFRSEKIRKNMSIEEFTENMEMFRWYVSRKNEQDHIYIFEIPDKEDLFWVRLSIRYEEDKIVGLAEDITKETLELKKMEYERDYDLLTNILNRRAFNARLEQLFQKGKDVLGTAALMMIDLDNLKFLNDSYGHDFGDKYIQKTAAGLKKYTPKESVVARMSGDEFFVFFYGYDSKDEVRKKINHCWSKMDEEYLELPNKQKFRLRMSGGIAWYPDNTDDYTKLIKYADFAMYKVKKRGKGRYGEFDRESYFQDAYLLQNKEELNHLIEEELIEYYFQPIIDVKTGETFAYEALMRSRLDSIPTVYEILSLAKQESKLYEIERLTWFKSMESFVDLVQSKAVKRGTRVFINSIPNQDLDEKDVERFELQYGEYLDLIVQEITEEERGNRMMQAKKEERMHRWGGGIAIDDYGSGYNSEHLLLSVTAQYLKIDMKIIRDIHLDRNKQQIVKNIIYYAHERDIRIIAEGVEAYEEMQTVVKLGADYIQGYYFAKPSLLVQHIDEQKKKRLLDLQT